MRRWWPAAVAVVVVSSLLVWWLWPAELLPAGDEAAPSITSANEGALETLKPSSWNAPIQQRGERKLTGVVLRDGKPVAGAVVTAVAAHGEEVLSDLPCKCDNHCGQKLLACGCAEASGQLVELVAARTGESAPLARATSDADGTFTLTGLEETTLTLFADAVDGVGWLGNVSSDSKDTKIVLAEGRSIRGKVLSSDGKPAKGALVTAIFAEHSRFFDVVADDKGEFRLGPLPLGKYAVVAMQGGLLPDHKQVGGDDTETVTLELSVPRTLSGSVLSDSVPVPGATVKLEGMHRKRTVITDAKGEFRVERLRPGSYELTAESSKGLGTASSELPKLGDRTGVTITLGAGEPLSGRVLTEDGAPVSEARISLLVGSKWRTMQTDEHGAFLFVGVGPEQSHLLASKAGLLDARGEGRGGESGIELRMAKAAVISGLVRSNTSELVLAYSIRATATDGGLEAQHEVSQKSVDGGFALEVWPGEYELQVDAPPLERQTMKVSAPSSGVVVVMRPGARIRGQALDEDGLPAGKGGRVSASGGVPSMTQLARTDAEGRFELAGLRAGKWSVEVRMYGESMSTWRASGEVSVVEAGTAELVLRPKPGARFAGVVISSEGEPVAGVEVMGWQPPLDGGYEPGGMSSAMSDAQGRFRLRNLAAGPVRVRANLRAAHSEAQLSATAPNENVVLKLSAGTTISGRVVDAEGKAITSFEILHESVEAADGRFSLPMSSTTTTLGFEAEGYAQLVRTVKLVSGDNPLGDVVLQRGRPVTGVVRDLRTRAPISGALIDIGIQPSENFWLSEKNGAVKTDAQGRYRLPAVDASSTFIFATAAQYVSARKPLAGNTVDFELSPASVLTVKLIDVTNAAVQRAYVTATQPGKTMVPLRMVSAGTWEAKSLWPGVWNISVATPDERIFRGSQVTLGEAPTAIVIHEATDGVTVELKLTESSDGMMLIPGTHGSTALLKDALNRGDSMRVLNGSAKHVLPGPWTVVVFRRSPIDATEAAVQPIEVKAGINPAWTISPSWQPVDLDDEDDTL